MGTKDTVLELFEKNRGVFISGEKIAGDLNISRTAVWKAVKKLQKDGYEIKAVTNRGYCLSIDSDIPSVQGIKQFLSEDCSGLRIEVLGTVDSTNLICRNKGIQGEKDGYVIIAGGQTKGRGRSGRSFFSPSGTGIYMSILLNPRSYPGTQVLRLTSMAAVAVCEAIESVSEKKADIKWVNDIYMDGKKVCGILSEGNYDLEDGNLDAVIVGIGINVYPPVSGFPEEIASRAGSVFEDSSSGKRNFLTAEVLNRFMAYYKGLSTNDHLEEYKRRSLVIGRVVEISKNGQKKRARVLGLNDDCALLIKYDDGTEDTLIAGEVRIIGID